MFSAVTNLGAGGTKDIALSDTSNAVLNATFALAGLVSGGINNRKYFHWHIVIGPHIFSVALVLGPRITLCIGTLGYALYVGALWWYASITQIIYPLPAIHHLNS